MSTEKFSPNTESETVANSHSTLKSFIQKFRSLFSSKRSQEEDFLSSEDQESGDQKVNDSFSVFSGLLKKGVDIKRWEGGAKALVGSDMHKQLRNGMPTNAIVSRIMSIGEQSYAEAADKIEECVNIWTWLQANKTNAELDAINNGFRAHDINSTVEAALNLDKVKIIIEDVCTQ